MARSRSLNLPMGVGRKRRRRRILLRGLFVLAVLVVTGIGLCIWAARALPRIAASQISRLTNTRAQMGAFDFHRDGSISIDGLVVRPGSGQQAYDDAILWAKKVHAQFSLRSLLTLKPRLTEIRIDDFILDVQADLDTGRWNVGDLRINASGGRPGGTLPAMILERGKLRCSKASGGKLETIMSVPIEARCEFRQEPRQAYHFEIWTAGISSGYGQSRLSGHWRRGELAIAGGLSSTDIPSLGRAWAVDVLAAQLTYDSNDRYALDLRVKNAHSKHSPEVDAFRMLGPSEPGKAGPVSTLQWFFGRYRPSGTVAEFTFNARGNLKRLNESELTGDLHCADVSVRDVKFPYAIDHLAGRVSFTQSSVVLDRLAGKHGDVDMVIDGWTRNAGRDRLYQYRVTSDNMVLDESLYTALGAEEKSAWDLFKPTGTIGVDYRLIRTSPTHGSSSVSVDLQQVAATYEKFPYPLKGLTGRLYFDSESVIASGIRSQAGKGWIHVDGKITRHDTDNPMYYISIDGNDVPLDRVLAASLPPGYRRLYEQFDASGAADIRAKVFTVGDGKGAESVTFVADVDATMDSLKPERLGVILTDASADISITPQSLSVRKLAARYGEGRVTLAGGMHLADDSTPQRTSLKIAAEEILLNPDTIGLLPDSLKRHVTAFDPQGRVNLTVDYAKGAGDAPPSYTAVVECLGNSIRHERFAYPLHDVRGKIVVKPDAVIVDGIEARPAGTDDRQSAIRIDGRLNSTGGDSNLGAFAVKARNVPFTDELGRALPTGFARMYRDMAPRGVFDLDVEIPRISQVTADDRRMDLAGKATIHNCDLKISGSSADLCGDLRIDATYSTKAGVSDGHIELDAQRLTIRGKPVTNLKADILFDPSTRSWSARDFLGDCCGGRVLGRLDVSTEGQAGMQYLLQASLDHVDVQQFLQAGKMGPIPEADRGSGTMNASLSLGARVGDDASRLGACKIDITDMRVARVSPLANLVSVLQLGEPTEYTFDRMLIDSYLRQDTLLIQKLDMSGRNMAFVGSGTVDTPSGQVNLTLTSRGRRVATAEPSILQSLAEGLGGAVMRMEVTGRIDNPCIETKTLPLFEDSIRILGAPR